MIQGGKRRVFAMGRAVRTDYTVGEVRRFAKHAKDAGQARRLLAIAAVLDGASWKDAAKVGGMDRQTLRDWVIRFIERPSALAVLRLINSSSSWIAGPGDRPSSQASMLPQYFIWLN
jgi:hypothetical protein